MIEDGIGGVLLDPTNCDHLANYSPVYQNFKDKILWCNFEILTSNQSYFSTIYYFPTESSYMYMYECLVHMH